MPEPAPPHPPAPGRDALRVVLFGLPAAGKTSLLGALAQAAQTQEPLLNGHLADPTHGLDRLRHELYEDVPRETLGEVVAYPIALDPLRPRDAADHLDAVLMDCDGRAANDLLARRRPLAEAGGEDTLAGAVQSADALVLLIDASAPPEEIDADFAEFGQFLHLLEENRGGRVEVGGLPVFLVLSKCDLLARPGDTAAAWMDRIEARKAEVGGRFRDFLAAHPGGGQLLFGSLDLHLWATAVKRPALADNPAHPREPFGVAELFRLTLALARGFRSRREQSGRRLLWTAAGTGGLVALLTALALGLVAVRHESLSNALAARVEAYRLNDGAKSAAERLRDPLPPKIAELKGIVESPDFGRLSPEDREFVQGRLQELEDYAAYRDRLRRVRIEYVGSEADLAAVESRLHGDLALPVPYGDEWADTEAGRRRDRLLKDAAALRRAADEAEEWYRRLDGRGQELGTFAKSKPADAPSWEDWLKRVHSLFGQTFPHPPGEELPDAPGLIYATVLGWDRVTDARKDWEATRLSLERLSDRVAALGLAGRTEAGERPPLDIPTPFTLEQAEEHCRKLQQLYPRLLQESAAVQFPEAVEPAIRRVARASYEHLLGPGRAAVLAHLRAASADGRETPEVWRKLIPWLDHPTELRAWRVLADLLAPLQGEGTRDPVTALREFAAKDEFTLNVGELTLTVPFDRRLRPAGPLAVYHADADTPAWVFTLKDEEGRRDARERVTTYTLTRAGGSAIAYRPGDRFSARLPVRREGDAGTWVLTWDQSRSEVYQFERLTRPPRLHRPDQANTPGDELADVTLAVPPKGGWPRVPDLIPVVVLKAP